MSYVGIVSFYGLGAWLCAYWLFQTVGAEWRRWRGK
jgi:hypothetical protein